MQTLYLATAAASAFVASVPAGIVCWKVASKKFFEVGYAKARSYFTGLIPEMQSIHDFCMGFYRRIEGDRSRNKYRDGFLVSLICVNDDDRKNEVRIFFLNDVPPDSFNVDHEGNVFLPSGECIVNPKNKKKGGGGRQDTQLRTEPARTSSVAASGGSARPTSAPAAARPAPAPAAAAARPAPAPAPSSAKPAATENGSGASSGNGTVNGTGAAAPIAFTFNEADDVADGR